MKDSLTLWVLDWDWPSGFWFFVEKFSKLMTIMTVCSCRRTFICNSMPWQRLSCLSKREMFHIIRWIRCMWYTLFLTFANTKTSFKCVSKNLGAACKSGFVWKLVFCHTIFKNCHLLFSSPFSLFYLVF